MASAHDRCKAESGSPGRQGAPRARLRIAVTLIRDAENLRTRLDLGSWSNESLKISIEGNRENRGMAKTLIDRSTGTQVKRR